MWRVLVMKYLYCLLFVLGLGFIVATAEHHLNVEGTRTEDTSLSTRMATEPYISDYEAEPHGVPFEFMNNDYSASQEFYDHDFRDAIAVTSAQIKEPFVIQFELLQNQALQELSALINTIFDDYTMKKANGESISYLNFYRTYYPKLKELERSTDADFAEKYAQLEQELAHYGYSPDKALKFKEQFELTKQNKIKELMSLVLGE
jgi:hypothetical protein